MSRRRPPHCEQLEVDGESIRIRVAGNLTEADREALAEVVRAAKRRFEREYADDAD